MGRTGLPLSLGFAVLMNLIPILGPLHWDWIARDILVLYWVECVIVGLMWVIRIYTFEAWKYPFSVLEAIFSFIMRGVITALHMWWYAIVCFILGAVIIEYVYFPDDPIRDGIFTELYETGKARGLYWAALGLLGSHLFSLAISWFVQGGYLRNDPMDNIFRINLRYIVLWTIIALMTVGAEQAEEASVKAVIAMVVLKTLLEIGFMISDHKKDAARKKLPKPRHPSKDSKVRRA